MKLHGQVCHGNAIININFDTVIKKTSNLSDFMTQKDVHNTWKSKEKLANSCIIMVSLFLT